MEIFSKRYTEMKGPGKKQDKTFSAIPRFYYKVSELVFLFKFMNQS